MGRDINYEEVKKPYEIFADVLVWYNEDYFAVCSVEEQGMRPLNDAEFELTSGILVLDGPLVYKAYKKSETVSLTLTGFGTWKDKATREGPSRLQAAQYLINTRIIIYERRQFFTWTN